MSRTKASHTFLTEGITAEEMARLLLVSKRRVSQLAAAGILQRIGRDRYSPMIAGYAEYRAKLVQEKQTKTATSIEFDGEKLRRLRQANDRADANLIPTSEVEECIGYIVSSFTEAMSEFTDHNDFPDNVNERVSEQVEIVKMGIRTRTKREITRLRKPRQTNSKRRVA